MLCKLAVLLVTIGLCYGGPLSEEKNGMEGKIAAGWDRFENGVKDTWEEASEYGAYAKDQIEAKTKGALEQVEAKAVEKEAQWKDIWAKLEAQEKKKEAQFKEAWENLELEGKRTWDEMVAEEEAVRKLLEAQFREAWEKLRAVEEQFDYSSGCHCSQNTCGCCVDLRVKAIKVDTKACVNASYLPKEYGIELSLSLGDKVIFHTKISAKSPPPLCIGIPHFYKDASICLNFYDMNISTTSFSGCIKLEVKFLHITLVQAHLGCFNFPLMTATPLLVPLDETREGRQIL